MLSDGPPSSEAVTVSRTWPELTDVKIFTSSGMIAPASVPHEMIAESFHHRPNGSADSPVPIRRYDTRNVRPTETSDVSHTRIVCGCAKIILSAFLYCAFVMLSLMR